MFCGCRESGEQNGIFKNDSCGKFSLPHEYIGVIAMREKLYKILKRVQTWIDGITTGVASVLIGVMFAVIIANVVLRAIPAVGGFRWYMEFSQYANVWAMLIGAAGIAVQGTNLRVEAVDALAKKIPYGEKISKIIVDIALILFYIMVYRSGRVFAAKSMIIKVSTMPQFKMGQVYQIFPYAALLCLVAAAVHLLVTLLEPKVESPMEIIAHEMEGKGETA